MGRNSHRRYEFKNEAFGLLKGNFQGCKLLADQTQEFRMKPFQFILSLTFIFLFFSTIEAKSRGPMQIRQNIDISDGELLHYTIYHSGEPFNEFTMVTKYLTNHIVKAYLQFHLFSAKTPMPSHYTNFNSYAVVDLSMGNQMEYLQDFSSDFKKDKNLKGQYYQRTFFDQEVTTVSKFWDGYESRETKSRIVNRDLRFPSWEFNSFVVWGGRMLDWEKPGEVSLWTPVTKELVKGTMYKIKDRIIVDTPVGKFDTIKVGIACTDPFLASLLKQFTDSMTSYIENGPKRRLVKIENAINNEVWILDKIEIVK
jgi:hypothetical protein